MDPHPQYWSRQAAGKPLFPDMSWSRPENKLYAGKLLVVGGNAYGFVAPAEAYAQAEKAGIGVVRMLLPDSVRRYVGGSAFDAGDFAPTTPSGSFSQKALAELLPLAAWADAVLLAGDLGRNSETAILLEKFATKYAGPLTLAGDSVDYFLAQPAAVLERPDTLLALDFGQLQRLAVGAHYTQAFTSQLDLVHFVQRLHDFSALHSAHLLVRHLDQTFIATAGEGRVGSTPSAAGRDLLGDAAHAAVWWLQTPSKPFEALMTSVI